MMLKRVGDSTDPWRTPLSMENGFETAPSTWTLHVPPSYQFLMSLQVLPLMPMENRRSRNTGNSTLSKAFWRSRRHMCTVEPPFMYLAIISWDAKMASAHPTCLRKADWLRCGKPASARHPSILDRTRISRTVCACA